MKKIHLIMPMCGHGARFAQKGFTQPKPLIPLQGKPFFYWATMSLVNLPQVMDVTFVILQEHVDQYQIDEVILQYFPYARLIVLPEVLNGAVLTCIQGVRNIHDDNPIIFNDCDHAFKCSAFAKYLDSPEEVDGGLMTFNSNEDRYSYIQYDDDGDMIGTVEKVVVSNDAICGAYYFKSRRQFIHYAYQYLIRCPYQEFYLSGVFNEMIQDLQMIKCFPTDCYLSFGTPEDYEKIKDSNLFTQF